jgi:3-hydroxy-3-methylglutaryl CoA synthase
VDLEATSESCFASASYVYSLTQDREDFVSVRLYDEPVEDEKGRTERTRYQSCFNRIFNDYLARGKTALTPKEVDEFAIRFRDECVKPAAPVPVDK